MQERATDEADALDLADDDEEPSGGRFNRRLFMGITVVVVATAYLISLSLDAASAIYLEVDEAIASADEFGDRRVRIGGSVAAGTIEQAGDGLDIRFMLENQTGASALAVSYRGVPPDIFGDNATIFVEGNYGNSGVFEADVLLTRHPDTMSELSDATIPESYRTSS